MVYSIIFAEWPDRIKIGYASRGLVSRYGGMRKFEEYWTWNGDKNHETALRCLMGLRPIRGLDWFELTEDRYRLANEIEQDYLDVIAMRVAELSECNRCEQRYFRKASSCKCPRCGCATWSSPLLGQTHRTSRDYINRRQEEFEARIRYGQPERVFVPEHLTSNSDKMRWLREHRPDQPRIA